MVSVEEGNKKLKRNSGFGVTTLGAERRKQLWFVWLYFIIALMFSFDFNYYYFPFSAQMKGHKVKQN